MPTKYPQSFKDRATRMVFDRLEDEDAPSRYVVIRETAPKLSIATETLRRWVEQAEVDTGKKSGVSTDSQEQIRKLKRENAELCRQVPYDPTDLAAIVNARPDHPLTHVIADRTQAWWHYLGQDRSNPCDPLALLALVQPELFDFQQAEISFVPDGEDTGKTVWNPSASATSCFATGVDVQRARQAIRQTIISCMQAAPTR